MNCDNCGDVIEQPDTHYESVTPVDGGGRVSSTYCSIGCLNEDAGFSDEEIKSLMRQHGYEVPPDLESEWTVSFQSNLTDQLSVSQDAQGEFFVLADHIKKDYSVELYWDPLDKVYEIVLYTYDWMDGEKVGLTDVEVEQTAVTQRAIAYAEEFMEQVENEL